MATQGFSKSERLWAKKLIEQLYSHPTGSLFAHPIKLTYFITPLPVSVSVQVMISVPKRNFKKAHQRNRIKRQLREVYRKNKFIVNDCLILRQQQACFLIGYVGKEHTPTEILEQKLNGILKKFVNEMAANNT